MFNEVTEIVPENLPTVEELRARGIVILDRLHQDEQLEAMASLHLITQDVGDDFLRFRELWVTWTESFERVLGIAQRVRG
jgi:hypothetical protein